MRCPEASEASSGAGAVIVDFGVPWRTPSSAPTFGAVLHERSEVRRLLDAPDEVVEELKRKERRR